MLPGARTLIVAIVTFATLAVTAQAGATPTRVYTKTVVMRWPTVRHEIAAVFPVRVGSTGRRWTVSARFPSGAVASSNPAFDYIVDCAGAGPSFASVAATTLDGVAWVTVVLESGSCSGTAGDAGHAVKITLTLRPA